VTSAKRASSAPSVPTLDEAGLPGFDLFSWYGVVGPVGISKETLARLNAAIGKVVNTPEMKNAFNKQGLEAQTDTLEEFTTFIHSEITRNAKLIKSSGVNTK
jgi:tripartite-type tricarboxylate transporter receptor subunit TctC